jgi:hypothetical protein
MRRPSRLAFVAAAVSAWGVVLSARAPAQSPAQEIPEAVAQNMLKLGLQNIDKAVCDGFNTCAPATPEEFEYPPITLDHVRAAILTGTRSAFTRWCGLDANRRSVAPMVRYLQQKLRFNARQVALVAVIHGIQESIISDELKKKGECDEATRSKLDEQLPRN